MGRWVREAPFLFSRFIREVILSRGIYLLYKAHMLCILVGMVLYFLSPIDLIPEGVVGLIGLMDDFIILALVVCVIGNVFLADQRNRAARGARAA